MTRVAALGVMVALALVQVTWAPRLAIAGGFANPVLVTVVAITWTSGVRVGMAWACIGGVLLDLTAPGPVGPHAVALLTAAYATSVWARNFERANALHAVLTAAAATAVYSLTLVVTDGVLGMQGMAPGVFIRLTLAAAAFNAVLAPFALEAARRSKALVHEAPKPA
jgi:rod shape-determining protein MreD